MPVELNHTIIGAHDALTSATFLAEILGLDPPIAMGPFQAVSTNNGVSLDFITAAPEEINRQHYAFLVTESEFDEIFARIQDRQIDYWADPRQSRPGEISTDHGRGFYFLDPAGQYLEVLTKAYEPW